MARFRSPITGHFVSFAAAVRWDYDDEVTGISAKEIAAGRRAEPEPEFEPEIEFDEEFFFDAAEAFEEIEFDEIADVDFPYDEFLDEVFDDFDDVDEDQYSDEN